MGRKLGSQEKEQTALYWISCLQSWKEKKRQKYQCSQECMKNVMFSINNSQLFLFLLCRRTTTLCLPYISWAFSCFSTRFRLTLVSSKMIQEKEDFLSARNEVSLVSPSIHTYREVPVPERSWAENLISWRSPKVFRQNVLQENVHSEHACKNTKKPSKRMVNAIQKHPKTCAPKVMVQMSSTQELNCIVHSLTCQMHISCLSEDSKKKKLNKKQKH